MQPFVKEISGIDPANAFLGVKHLPYSLWLDSNAPEHKNNRYSFIASHPIETIEAQDCTITVTNWEQQLSFKQAPFKILQSRINSWISGAKIIPGLPPFQGGAAGLFGYDLGRYLEYIPRDETASKTTPDMAIGIYDQVLAFDHTKNKTYLFTHARNEKEATKKQDFLLDIYAREYKKPNYETKNINWHSNFSKNDYINAVQKTIDYIHEGDIFQANIAQRFSADKPKGLDPLAHYLHMREINPAPFSTYMNLGDIEIASASPERFLTVEEKTVITCPIKGTRPRSTHIIADKKSQKDLMNSQKDRAENTMIVDLLRNDLSKVCTPESVKVSKLCELESFSSVHHLVSTIQGELADKKTALDALRACFPGGSITGAPKIRAMEIIEELEQTPRGAYCGSIGYIGFDGNMDTNILIRTLVYEKDKITLSAGGGITAESDPEAEYQETLDKARGIMESFETQKSDDRSLLQG